MKNKYELLTKDEKQKQKYRKNVTDGQKQKNGKFPKRIQKKYNR